MSHVEKVQEIFGQVMVAAQGAGQIGNLSDLETEDKSSLVGAINEAKHVQPDWNQNDETAKDYVKNRLCGYDSLGGVDLD